MLTIRLQRVGRRGDPAHRVIVQESSRAPQSGNFVEILGSYNPRKEGHTIDAERAKYWVEQGVQISPTVHNLFVDIGVIDEAKVNPLPQKSPVYPEQPEESSEGAASDEGTASTESAEEAVSESSDADAASQEETGEDSAVADTSEEPSSDNAEAAPASDEENTKEEQTA